MGEYKNNSFAARNNNSTIPEKKKVEKIISGTAKTKKKSIARKMVGAFIPEDVDDVKTYIFEDIVVPAAKDILLDAVRAFLGVNGRSGGSNNHRESYRSYYDKENKKRDYGKSRTTSRDYNDVYLNDKREAEEVLIKMDELMQMYGVVSIGDFYDLVGITGNYTDEKYGWTDIRSASIIRTYDGYKIKLPRALPID